MADELERGAQLEELRSDLCELAAAVPVVVDAINVAVRHLTEARDAIVELGRGCEQVAKREILSRQPGE